MIIGGEAAPKTSQGSLESTYHIMRVQQKYLLWTGPELYTYHPQDKHIVTVLSQEVADKLVREWWGKAIDDER